VRALRGEEEFEAATVVESVRMLEWMGFFFFFLSIHI
jgi:hypothetical protein